MSLYCFEHARTPEQLGSHPRQRILFSTAHWSATLNEFPYEGTSLHLLLVPHQHAADLLELDREVHADFWVALATAAQRHGLRHYGLGVRNGDCRRTGGTIRHVHAHVLVASGTEGAPPVRMRFSGRPAGG